MTDYHDHPALSSSEVACYLSDPIEWYHVYRLRDWPRSKPTSEMQLGTAIHRMIELGSCDAVVREIPVEVLNEQGHCKGKAWYQWKADNPAEIYLKPGETSPLTQIWSNLQASQWFRDVHASSEREVEHFWNDPDLGECRCKFDAVSGGMIIDWKSTSKRCARTFAADAYARFYDVRLALYARGFRDKYGTEPEVIIGAIQTSGGYRFTPYVMPTLWLHEAEARLLLAHYEMQTFDLGRYLDVTPEPLDKPRYARLDLETAI